jgi:hypothetical protein
MNKPHLWPGPAGKCLSETREELLHFGSTEGDTRRDRITNEIQKGRDELHYFLSELEHKLLQWFEPCKMNKWIKVIKINITIKI